MWRAVGFNESILTGVPYQIEVTTDFINTVLFQPQVLPFTEDNGIVTISSGPYLENGYTINGAYPYANFNFSSGIGVVEFDLKMSVYPNPVKELLIVEIQGVGQLEIFDLSGRLILKSAVANNEVLDLKELNSGVYIYKLSTGLGLKSGKFIKQ